MKPSTKLLLIIGIPLSIYLINKYSPKQETTVQKTQREYSEISKKKKKLKDSLLTSKNYDPTIWTYTIPGDYLKFAIKFKKINKKLIKNSIKYRNDKYEKPKQYDGYKASFEFEVTNQSDKDLYVPFPRDFCLKTPDESLGRRGLYNHSFITSHFILIDKKTGNDITEGEEIKCYKPTYDYICLEFRPNETKSIIITFDRPFPTWYREIVFEGFGKSHHHGTLVNLESEKVEAEYLYYDD